METKSKAETFIGFSVRAGKCRFGAGTIETLKRAKIIICCETAAHSSRQIAAKLARKFNCPLYVTQGITLEKLAHKENSKILAITDAGLAQAVADNADGKLIRISLEM